MSEEGTEDRTGTRGGADGKAPPGPCRSLWCATWPPLPAGTAARTAAGREPPPGPAGGLPQDGARQRGAALPPPPRARSAPVAGTAVVSVNLLFL